MNFGAGLQMNLSNMKMNMETIKNRFSGYITSGLRLTYLTINANIYVHRYEQR